MFTAVKIQKNSFRDSVYLMRLSSLLRGLEGVEGAEVIMGTEHNKKFLQQGQLLTPEIERDAGANDMIIVVRAKGEKQAEDALNTALAELQKKESDTGGFADGSTAFTFESALQSLPGANLALLSIPGRYVEREALKILDAGLHLFIFSDNVPLETEIALKKKGASKGLLVMGPDCGTAIINGIPIAFANAVRRGNIGIVAAAGTGLQEVSSLIHNLGEGISQGIGTGGRDVKDAVGGITMLLALEALMHDPETKVIVVVSKPPGREVAARVRQLAARSEKPVVLNFIGEGTSPADSPGCVFAGTLKEAAEKAVSLLRYGQVRGIGEAGPEFKDLAGSEKAKLKAGQKYLRGLFSGGTLAYEFMAIYSQNLDGIYSNIPLDSRFLLKNSYESEKHTIIDLGEDEFTQGRPHPMIDPTLRNRFIVKESNNPETAVILLDVVLGYGSHADPAGRALEAIRQARSEAGTEGRHVVFVASVCGTDLDPQNRAEQVAKLESEGVLVFPSNADAAMFVRELLS